MARRASPGDDMRSQIEAALAAGANPEDLTLRLTRGDALKLRRDPSIPLADIRFSEGVMSYLGVKVVEGGVDASFLERPA